MFPSFIMLLIHLWPTVALQAPPLLVSTLLALSVLTVTQTRPAVRMQRERRVPLTQVMLTAGRNRCTPILQSNDTMHLALSQRTGMKNLFSSHFFGDWLTVLWQGTLWLLVSSLVRHQFRRAPEKSLRRPRGDTMNYASASAGGERDGDHPTNPPSKTWKAHRHTFLKWRWGDGCWRKTNTEEKWE